MSLGVRRGPFSGAVFIRYAWTMATTVDAIRLSLHVLAASVWVGGQITLALLVPLLRARDPELPRIAARGFNKFAWPAFGVLLVTGVWNIAATDDDHHGNAYSTVLLLKLLLVAGSGLSAYLHIQAKDRRQLALWGALSGITAIGALVVGVVLAG